MMYKLSVPLQQKEKHECIGRHEGDWVVYRCTVCDYELKEHWDNGEIQILNAKKNINHIGSFSLEDETTSYKNVN